MVWFSRDYRGLVRKRGLEPLRVTSPDPKSGASANFATSAWVVDRRIVSWSGLGWSQMADLDIEWT
jgi:hypothetical protein